MTMIKMAMEWFQDNQDDNDDDDDYIVDFVCNGDGGDKERSTFVSY